MRPIVKSKNKVNIPDGIYCGSVGGANLTILSQKYHGEVIALEFGIRTMNLMVVVIVKDSIAHCFDSLLM